MSNNTICFVIALNSEAKSFLDVIENKKEIRIADKIAYTGTILNKKIVVAISGIGKVNASLTAQALIDKFSPDFVFNFGTAGGTNSSVQIKRYYLIDKCCQFDFDLFELDGVPVGYIQDYKGIFFKCYTHLIDFLPLAQVASADRFSDDVRDNQTINAMPCNLRDMEAGAIGQVCTANGVKFIAVKGVTDVYKNGTSAEQFVKNLNEVSHGFADVIKKILEKL